MSELADYYKRLSNSLGSLPDLVACSLEPCVNTAILSIKTYQDFIKEKIHLTDEFIRKLTIDRTLSEKRKTDQLMGKPERIKKQRAEDEEKAREIEEKQHIEKTQRIKKLQEKAIIRKEETQKRKLLRPPSRLREKPYYIILEEKYAKNFEIPELNRRKEELKKRREMFLPVTTVKPLKKGNLCKSDTRFNLRREIKKPPLPKFKFTIKRPIIETERTHIAPRKDCEYLEMRRNVRRKLENELINGTANKSKNLDEIAKRNEGLLRYRYSHNFFDVQAIEAKDRINELYIESIKSKLDMLS